MTKLNQLLAIEKNLKNKRETEFTKLYQSVGKAELSAGFTKTYQPKSTEDEQQPPQTKRVQLRAEDAIKQVKTGLVDLFDIIGAKNKTNCVARADVVVDGNLIVAGVPAVHLLFIEKKLTDIIAFIKTLPVLSADEAWKRNDAQGIWETDPVEVVSTKKVIEHTVVVPPTKEHPAQVRETSKDVPVGTWRTVKFSGAMRSDDVASLLERAEKLQRAVKFAREEANQTPAIEAKNGAAVLNFIFDGVTALHDL